MKTNKILFGALMLVLTGSLLFTSCRKKTTKQEEEPDRETATISDNTTMENTSSDIDAMGGEAAESGTIVGRGTDIGGISLAPSATVTGYGTSTITVDFGTGVSCKDGRTRSGKLIYDLSGSPASATFYRNPGFKVVVTSQNYVVDGNAVTIINKTIENTTPASVGGQTVYTGVDLTWSISSNISIAKANNGGTITWSCTRTKTLINTNDPMCYHGQTIPITWSKAKIKISGSASGTNAKGEGYTVTASGLVRDFTCTPDPTIHPNKHPFVAGTLDYKPGDRATRHIDYGNGGCDNSALVTINGVTYSVDLP